MAIASTTPVLPIEAYTSQEWFDREQSEIFSNTWQFAGFVEDLADPGDYLTVQAGLNNIVVVLDNNKQLQDLNQLEYLDLSQTQVIEMAPLKDFTQLEELNLSQTQVSDIAPLKHLRKLIILTDDKEKAKRWKGEGLKVSISDVTDNRLAK
ncbi:MAG: leucine-rich repeat domain-containing protein [Cyanobacteria bacterium P01_F01_bin.150]